MPNGIVIIDKPQGWTSMDVCAKLRGILHFFLNYLLSATTFLLFFRHSTALRTLLIIQIL